METTTCAFASIKSDAMEKEREKNETRAGERSAMKKKREENGLEWCSLAKERQEFDYPNPISPTYFGKSQIVVTLREIINLVTFEFHDSNNSFVDCKRNYDFFKMSTSLVLPGECHTSGSRI